MGMDIANFYSVNQKFLDNKTRNKIKMCLSKIWNKKDFKKISAAKLVIAMKNDKKSLGDSINLILCKGFGKVFKYKVKIDNNFEKIINEYLKKQLYD